MILTKTRTAYIVLCIAGTILPYAQFLPWLRANGLDLSLFAAQMFEDPISSFFVMDVVVSTLALWVFVFLEGRRLGVRHLWAPIAANLLVGVSLALPLFLLMREVKTDRPS